MDRFGSITIRGAADVAGRRRTTRGLRNLLLASSALIASALPALAQDAMWIGGGSDYNTGANWDTGTVPTGIATFDVFGGTGVNVSGSTTVETWAFTAGGPFTITNSATLALTGAGIDITGGAGAAITNNFSMQFHNTSSADSASIVNTFNLQFYHSSTAGTADITNSGVTQFYDTATAGSATITNNSVLQFNGNSTGGSAAIVNNLSGQVDFTSTTGLLGDNKVTAGSIAGAGSFQLGANELTVGSNGTSTEVSGVISGVGGSLVKTGAGTLTLTGANTYDGGTTISQGTLQLGDTGNTATIVGTVTNNSTLNVVNANLNGTTGITNNLSMNFQGSSTAGSATITNSANAALSFIGTSSAGSATISNAWTMSFSETSTAGSASIINDGNIAFNDTSTAGTATITNNALLQFVDQSTAGSAVIVNNLGGVVDFSDTSGTLGDNKVSAGSIAGQGNYELGVNELTVGSNNSSTEVSGAISGSGGSLVKTGSGTLTLTGTNTYTGGTTITSGTLQIGTGGTSGSIVGDIVNNSALVVNRDGLLTLDGVISGTGTLTKDGDGTLTLTNTNNYDGGTVIDQGTLQLGNGGTTGSITGNVVNNGILAINRSDTYTFAGEIQGSGAFEQNGIGKTILTGTNFYDGTTTVNAGTLQVDGSLTASTTTVNTGATLSGSGSVFDTTINSGGTLMPGDGSAPATLTVTGNLTFNGGSTYVVFMTPTVNSLTNVSGVATLSGTVNVIATPGVYNAGQQYNILTATGGFGGTTFTDLTTTGFGSNAPTLGYDADDVFLMFGTNQVVLIPSFTGNRGNVANGINNAMLGGATPPPGFDALFALTGPQLSNGLSQISGEAAGGATQAGIQMSNHFLSLMLNPFSGAPDGNWGTTGFARGFGAGEKELSPEAAAAYAAVTPKDKRADTFGARWSFWGGGFGGYNNVNGDAGAGTHNTSTRTYGFAAGSDYRPSSDSVIGFAMSGGGTTWNLADGMGSGRSDVFQIGGYGAKQFGAAYVSAAASYGWHDASTDRTITVSGTDRLKANFNVHNIGGRLETGYRFLTSFAGITPYASLQVQNFSSPGYSEYAVSGTNTFALSYGSRSNTVTRTELGAWFDKLFALDGGNSLLIRTRAAWVHDHYSDPSMGAAFQTLPGSSFTVDAAAGPEDSLLLTAGAELKFTSGWSVRAKFDGEFAGTGQTYAGTGTLRYAW